MKPARLSTYFVPYTDADFNYRAAFIIESMENNPHFPDPVPTLESIRILHAAYEAALLNAAGMDRIAVVEKNATRKKLEHELARLALYVMYIADDSETILISSGYRLTKTPEKIKMANPGNVFIKNGISSGQLTCSVKAVKGAKTYSYEITTDELTPESQWKGNTSSRSSYTFTNLQPGRRYFFRVLAIGTGNQKAYSTVSEKWAQ